MYKAKECDTIESMKFTYFHATAREFKNIRWMPFKKVVILAILSVIFAIAVGFYLGLIDNGMKQLFTLITRN